MEQKRNFIDKFLDIAPGGFYGILSVIIRMLGDFIAFLFFPGYSIINNMVSDLGVGPGGIFFSLGLIISGIISIPFYVALARSLKSEEVNESMRKTGLIFFYISDITYIMIAFFPSVEEIYLIYLAHGLFAIISWLTAIIYIIIFSRLMKKDGKFSALPSYSGYILIIVMIIFLCTWLPLIEWIMTFTFIIWLVIIASYMIYHNL
ncbi:MAG: DUF998 domain-containing protein [Promethearchaeota archaeon]|nr:MAG: DUF998 domain-containing protein [Candidatus Lokiarchaeota archaeon]